MNPIAWLEWIVSWILMSVHKLAAPIFSDDSGVTWTLSIVGLVLVIRIILIPLFVRQIRSMRTMQVIQPQMKAIQEKYAGDRQRQSEELMKLYREHKTSPFASCLPILAQAPVFFALFNVLNGIGRNVPKGVLTESDVLSARNAEFFGVPFHGTFVRASQLLPDTPTSTTHIVTIILIILMSATTFISQRQMIVKNTAPGNPIVQQQKILLYVFPIIFAISGVNFPIGVLLYWFTTNVWSMGQQFWVIRNSPSVGTPAYEAWEARRRRKGKPTTFGTTSTDAPSKTPESKPAPTPRQQPKRTPRSKRK